MKKLFIFIACIVLCSCDGFTPDTDTLQNEKCPFSEIKEFTYKGHDYISFHYINQAGVVHNPECKKCLKIWE